MTQDVLEHRQEDGIAHVRLNRPDSANAFSLALAEELSTAVARAAADPQCRVLLLSASGRFFSAGGDVTAMAAAPDRREFVMRLATTLHNALLALAASRLVTVSLVQGPTAGARLGLILNSDFVIASTASSFVSAYSAIGVTPDCGVSDQAIIATRALMAADSVERYSEHLTREADSIAALSVHPDTSKRIEAFALTAGRAR